MDKYDFIIIGGGAGAFAAAIRANTLKKRTLMINAGLPLGGTCVNVGCVPSKVMLHAAELLYRAKHHAVPGIELEIEKKDFSTVIQDELDVVEHYRGEKYEKVLSALENVTHLEGYAKFVSEDTVEVDGKKYTGEKILIATGSTATAPPISGLADAGYMTHIEALSLKEQPESLAIIGAGPIGLEFAQMFQRFGTKVTLLQRGERIFPYAEKPFTDRLTELFEREGIDVLTSADTTRVDVKDGKKHLTVSVGGEEQEIVVDDILVAAGKKPNTDKLNVDVAKVEVDGRGAIVVNEYYRTSNKDVYAVGDVAALPLRQETTAGREGSLASGNALEGEENTIDYDTVPYTIFTDPELSGVGLTEDEQMKRYGVCACRTVELKNLPKAGILRKTEGLIKMGIDPKTKQILGVQMLGPSSSEVIAEAMMLIKNKNTIDDVISSVPMFPTMAEALKLVALSFNNDISKLSCCV